MRRRPEGSKKVADLKCANSARRHCFSRIHQEAIAFISRFFLHFAFAPHPALLSLSASLNANNSRPAIRASGFAGLGAAKSVRLPLFASTRLQLPLSISKWARKTR